MPFGARVVIVGQHEIFRAGLRSILRRLRQTSIVGEASGGSEALALARRERPDLILLDGEMPSAGSTSGADGADLIRRLRTASARSAIVVLSGSDDPQHVLDAIGAGASAYLLKDVPTEDLSAAIDRAISGEAFVDPALAGRVVQAMTGISSLAAVPGPPEPLTARELEVLREISRGRTNKEIAFDLHMAVGTAKIHVERILRKLTATNRVEATTRALQYNLIDIDDGDPALSGREPGGAGSA